LSEEGGGKITEVKIEVKLEVKKEVKRYAQDECGTVEDWHGAYCFARNLSKIYENLGAKPRNRRALRGSGLARCFKGHTDSTDHTDFFRASDGSWKIAQMI
jgi:hypothetical protein